MCVLVCKAETHHLFFRIVYKKQPISFSHESDRMFNLFDREFALHPQMMLFHSNMFEDDKELRELRKQRREWLTEMDDKIQSRRKALIEEKETNDPARYSRKYSRSHSNINGKEVSETKDVIEENRDGQKSIHQKADKVEKDDGKIVDEEHVDVKLSQDKDDKNKWVVSHGGQTTTLDASDSTFSEKLQALMMTTNSSGTPQTRDINDAAKEETIEDVDVDEEEDNDFIDEIENQNEPDAVVSTPLPTAVMQKRTSKATTASSAVKNTKSKRKKQNKKQNKKSKSNKKSTKAKKNRISTRASRRGK